MSSTAAVTGRAAATGAQATHDTSTPDATGTPVQASTPAETGLRERKKQRTWQAIHEAAADLVTEHGLAATVEEICARAGVSSRTFFNYFPSKGHAALGLPAPTVPDDARAVFLAADGPIVADLCDLVARTVVLPEDHRRAKALVRARPELVPTMLQWMADTRLAVHAVACERTGADDARTAVTLVMAAVIEAVHRSATDSRQQLAERLRQVVREMVRLGSAWYDGS